MYSSGSNSSSNPALELTTDIVDFDGASDALLRTSDSDIFTYFMSSDYEFYLKTMEW